MNSKLISDAVSELDIRFVDEALNYKKPARQTKFFRWAAIAACVCVVMAVTIPLATRRDRIDTIGDVPILTEDGVVIPPMSVSLSSDIAADMAAFFIYQGGCYVQYEWLDNQDIVGEYLGSSTGLINEWTPRDGYVELAGSVSVDFYSVNGYDPSFMLCTKDEDGRASTYIRTTGITLKYGAELFSDRLNIDSWQSVSYKTPESWVNGSDEVYYLNEADTAAVENFIAELNTAEFLLWSSAVERAEQAGEALTKEYYLYFELENGMSISLRLYDGGYVRFQGMPEVCVQIPRDSCNEFIDLLDRNAV